MTYIYYKTSTMSLVKKKNVQRRAYLQSPPPSSLDTEIINAVENGDINRLKQLVNIPLTEVAFVRKDIRDAIEIACKKQFNEVVTLLIQVLDGGGLQREWFTQPIFKYGNKDMIVKFIQMQGGENAFHRFDSTAQRPATFVKDLAVTLKNLGYEDLLYSLLEDTASYSSDLDAVKSIMLLNPKIPDPGYNETRMFLRACANGNPLVAKYLLQREGGHVNPGGVFTQLHGPYSKHSSGLGRCFKQDQSFLETLVNDVRVIQFNEAFHSAILSDNLAALNWLFTNDKARAGVPDDLFVFAASTKSSNCLNYLLARADLDPSANENEALINTIKIASSSDEDLDIIKMLLRDQRVDPSARDNEAVITACARVKRGYSKVVRLLLQHPKVDASARNNEALARASKLGLEETVWELLQDSKVKADVRMMLDTTKKASRVQNPERFINSAMMLIPRLPTMPNFLNDPRMSALLPQLAESRFRIWEVLQLEKIKGLPRALSMFLIEFMGEPYQSPGTLTTLILFLDELERRSRERREEEVLLRFTKDIKEW